MVKQGFCEIFYDFVFDIVRKIFYKIYTTLLMY